MPILHRSIASIASPLIAFAFTFGWANTLCAQENAAWWKSLFKGTQKSVCDTTVQRPSEATVPSVVTWEPSEVDPSFAEQEPTPAVFDRPVGSVSEQFDQRIASLDSAWHTEEHALRGYRVQIFSGSLQAARETRARARKANSTWPVYLSSMPPNYRVTIGDFRTKWEAQKAQDAWNKAFPRSIVIPMEINLPPLSSVCLDAP